MLGKCLERLAPGKQILDSASYEVIVTDDSDGNGADAYCKVHFPFVRYIRGPRKGPAANRNNGARLALGDWLVFTDDDCQPDKDWLKGFSLSINEKNESLAFEGRTEAIGLQTRFDEVAPINKTGQKFWSCNIMVQRDLFKKMGGFNEGFPHAIMEDTDFYERIKQLTATEFVYSALVNHPWRKVTTKGLAKKMLQSHQFFLQERGQVWDTRFRFQRFKLLVARMGIYTKSLAGFNGKGFAYWLELLKFYIGMLVKR